MLVVELNRKLSKLKNYSKDWPMDLFADVYSNGKWQKAFHTLSLSLFHFNLSPTPGHSVLTNATLYRPANPVFRHGAAI